MRRGSMAFLQLLNLLLLSSFAVVNVQAFLAPPSRARIKAPITSTIRESTVDTLVTSDAPQSSSLGAWLPLGSASSLTGLNPTQIRICGLDIAVWHKPLPTDAKKNEVATEWSAMIDACPHRLAPLSQGRVDPNSGCIECPYHGWAFETDGSLKILPQLEEGRTIDAATGGKGAATSLPVHASGDLLFVFLPTEVTGESWPITRLPEHHYPYLKDYIDQGRTYYSRDLPYSLDFLLENFMDPAHIPFAHHSLQGTRDDARPIEMSVGVNNFTHAEVSFKDVSGGKERDGVLSFERPALYHFRTRANSTAQYQPNLLIFTAPIDEGKCRAIMPDFRLKFLPCWLGHLGSNRFLNSDTWLHNAERNARLQMDTINKQRGSVAVGSAKVGKQSTDGLNYILGTQSDLGPSVFRKWWKEHGFATSLGRPASASSLPKNALSRAEQIDPWEHHAKNCNKCRGALKRMRLLQKVNIAGAAASSILLRRKPAVISIAAILAGFYVHNFLNKFATTIEGNRKRGEIDDRSVAAIK